MSDRTDILTALGLVLRRLNQLADEVGMPGAQPEQVLKETESLGSKMHELLNRLRRLPFTGDDEAGTGYGSRNKVVNAARKANRRRLA
jgi:hypothetical protein